MQERMLRATRLLAVLACAAALAPAPARAVAPQVVGGVPVTPGQFPFAASLAIGTSRGLAACSGSLVAPSFVLTAAHCVTDADGSVVEPSAIEVAIGDEPLSANGSSIAAVQVVRHPLWDPYAIDDDWALVRLAHPSAATPVALAVAGSTVPAGTNATLVGWGKTSDASGLPDELQRAVLPVRDTATCVAAYGLFDAATQLCAGVVGPTGPDGCSGDSGGPLLVRTSGGGWQEVGVVSYGLDGGCTAAPTVFARVSSARPFIDAVVAGSFGEPHVTDVRVAAGETTATVTATVATGGMPTHVRLGAGLAAGHYGTQTQPVAVAAAAGTSRVTLRIAGLRPSTRYHLVVDAWSAVGGVRSADVAVTPCDRTRPRLAVTRSVVIHRGRRVRLPYAVADASRRVSLAASVSRAGRVVRRWSLPAFSLDAAAEPPVVWLVPRRTRPGAYLLCLAARDAAGNRSAPVCGVVHVRR
jgi:secreted trypsin-like serine protease